MILITRSITKKKTLQHWKDIAEKICRTTDENRFHWTTKKSVNSLRTNSWKEYCSVADCLIDLLFFWCKRKTCFSVVMLLTEHNHIRLTWIERKIFTFNVINLLEYFLFEKHLNCYCVWQYREPCIKTFTNERVLNTYDMSS